METTTKLSIEDWELNQIVIISNEVTTHDMILGRNFLVPNSVKVNHADDSLEINNRKIYLNVTEADPIKTTSEEENEQNCLKGTKSLKSKPEAVKQEAGVNARPIGNVNIADVD